MIVKPGQRWSKREPDGGVWDRVQIVAVSPNVADEFVVAPIDPFSGDADPAERQVVAVSATAESLEENYLFEDETQTTAPQLGDVAEAWQTV
jgi:hypothetical protein